MKKLLLHSSTKQDLDRIIKSAPHAVGIEGEPGTGKKYLSKEIISLVLNTQDIAKYPYFMGLNCAEAGIEEIREAVKFLALKIPGSGGYKRCLVFWAFEDLGHEAQNALLKSIEEPPNDTLIVITAISKARLLPTVTSRLSWINVRPVSLDESLNYFSDGYDKDEIKKAHILSSGNAGLMASLLDGYEDHPLVKSINEAKDFIGQGKLARLSFIEKASKDKEFDIKIFLNSLAKIFEAALRTGLNRNDVPDKKILDDLKKIIKAQNSLKYNANQKLILSDLIYNL